MTRLEPSHTESVARSTRCFQIFCAASELPPYSAENIVGDQMIAVTRGAYRM